ncbi:triosephosphate isomerase, putative [Plasmodium ovale]|uniref:Triosephosphate isomerase n=1 Tax=Plasmodium ovale TaxID=36330 RepID=A0A1D3TH73_PLAOA|nr:triosephosphate isomerase, putative [Plasmodium ovale]
MIRLFVLLFIYMLNVECVKCRTRVKCVEYETFNYSNSNDIFPCLKGRKKSFFLHTEYIRKKRKDNTDNKNILHMSKMKDKHSEKCDDKKCIDTSSFIYDNLNLVEVKEKKKKKKIIIGNWKCYLLKEEAYKLIDILTKIKYSNNTDLILSLNLLYIPYLLEKIKENKSRIYSCTQDVSLVNGLGAYTGETTATLIHEFGNTYTIIGHSERKRGFCNGGETIEQTAQKVYNAINAKLKVILCIGEDCLNQGFRFPFRKLRELLSLIKHRISKYNMLNIIIAFEPSFAVGTGNPVPSDILNSCYSDIKKNIAEEIDTSISEEMKIVYGGSVTKSNMKNYVDNTPVDGFLIGKGSLDESFIDIIKYVDESHLTNA